MHRTLDVSSVCHVGFFSQASYVFTSALPGSGTWSSPLLLEQTLAWFWLLPASSPPGSTQAESDTASARGQSHRQSECDRRTLEDPAAQMQAGLCQLVSVSEWFRKFHLPVWHSFSSLGLFETHQSKSSLQPSLMTKKSQDERQEKWVWITSRKCVWDSPASKQYHN